jgi:TPR repeat protein
MKRIKENNDPTAMCFMGRNCMDKGDYDTAFEYLTKAAELGGAGAHFSLSLLYHKGYGVEKDEVKETYHLEQAAIAGGTILELKSGTMAGSKEQRNIS